MENMYLTRKAIRKLPGKVMKTIPIPEPAVIEGFGCRLKHLPADLLLQKFLIVPGGTMPIILIPSTAGTGAEMTVGAVISQRIPSIIPLR